MIDGQNENKILLDFIRLIRYSTDNESFFVMFKHFLKQVRKSTQDDPTAQNEVIGLFIKTVEYVFNENVRCSRCNEKYKFRYMQSSVGQETFPCIELNCELCGDFYTYAEDSESVSYFNYKVVCKVNSLRRRGKGLKIIAYYGGEADEANLEWNTGEEHPTLWINLNRVRSVKEVQTHWNRSVQEVVNRKQVAATLETAIL